MNPEFTDSNDTSVTPTKEVKEVEETEEESETEEETSTEASTEEKTAEDKSKEITEDNKSSDSDKLAALEALRKTEETLEKDTSELDKEIEARRERIVEKRRERREKRDLVGKIDEVEPVVKDDLKDIDETTLQILERYTKAKGLVPRSEIEKVTYESHHKTAESSFYDKHKEYLPENDKDDVLYNALKKELALFAVPSNPALISKLFEKAHSEVRKQYPTLFKESKVDEQVNASQRSALASMGGGKTGGASRQPKTEGAKLSSIQLQALRQGGWSEDDIARLNK